MRYFFLIAFFSLLSFVSFAQSSVQFEKTTYDFGIIKEEKGITSCVFNFENTGKKSISIAKVEPSCGCTSSDWSKTPIHSRKKGFVIAEFNPTNRPGPFEKTLIVTFDSNPKLIIVLTIKGIVQPAPKTATKEFPEKIGSIRLKSNDVNFNHVYTNESANKRIFIFNDSEQDLLIKNIKAPTHIKIASEFKLLSKKQKGILKITYNPILKNDYGWVNDSIFIFMNDSLKEKIKLTITAFIEDAPQYITKKQLPTIGRIHFPFTEYTIKADSSTTALFPIKNRGKKTLQIKKIKTSCECLKVISAPASIKPYGENSLLVKYTSTISSKKPTSYFIFVFSTDPIHPTQTLLFNIK